MLRIRLSSLLVSGIAALVFTAGAPLGAAAAAASDTWTISPSQDPAGTDNRLYAVACSSASLCWAVGEYFNGAKYQTLIERSTPAGWVIVPSPNNTSTTGTNTNQNNVLNSISCVPSGPCFASGYWYDGENAAHTLIEESSGATWSIVASADVGPTVVDDFLNGITCISASDCWAVGETLVPGIKFVPFVPIPGTPAQTLIEHWDGGSWSIVVSPNSGFTQNVLESVACSSSSNCWAVGLDNAGNSSYVVLLEHYDGSAWSIVTGDNPSAQLNELDSAWCSTDGTCRTAGIQRANPATQTLMEATSGSSSSWTSDNGANTSTTQLNSTTGITCTDDVDCWAVGVYDSSGSFLFQTLVERRTATGWTVVPSANVSETQSDQLWGVGCADAATCWAVGYSTDSNGVNHTLIEGTATSSPAAPVPEFPAAVAVIPVIAAVAMVHRRRMRS